MDEMPPAWAQSRAVAKALTSQACGLPLEGVLPACGGQTAAVRDGHGACARHAVAAEEEAAARR